MTRRFLFLLGLALCNVLGLVAVACGHGGGGRCPLPVAPTAPPPPPTPEDRMLDCPSVPPESARFRTMRGYCDPDQNALCGPLGPADELALWRRLLDYQDAYESCARRCRVAWGVP